jgi:hypothetical protein
LKRSSSLDFSLNAYAESNVRMQGLLCHYFWFPSSAWEPMLPGSARRLVLFQGDRRQSLQVRHSQAEPGNEKLSTDGAGLL